MKKYRYALLLLLAPLAACYNDKEAELYPSTAGCSTIDVRYTNIIKPILDNSCALAGCHNATTPSSGYNFSLFADAQRAAQNGFLVGTTTHASGFSPMPQGAPKLPDCTLAQIQAWVAAGAPQ